jgi:serine/threonine-protein kinase RsbW
MADTSPPLWAPGEFTVEDLRLIRTVVQDAGHSVGVDPHRVGELVAVVHELVVNAVLYAGGGGKLTVIPSDTGLSVEVSDRGPGLPDTVTGRDRPPSDVPGGRGLWMARQMFPDLTLDSTGQGLTVTLFARRTPPDPATYQHVGSSPTFRRRAAETRRPD